VINDVNHHDAAVSSNTGNLKSQGAVVPAVMAMRLVTVRKMPDAVFHGVTANTRKLEKSGKKTNGILADGLNGLLPN
jgi:hypothetical protein